MSCLSCGDKGTPDGCPLCGKVSKSVIYVPEAVTDPKMLPWIPDGYRVPWDVNILKNSYADLAEIPAFIKYVTSLDNLVSLFRRGQLPTKSHIIFSSYGLGKTHLAYACLSLAADYGFQVCPILDNTEYRRLNNLSTDNQLYTRYLKNNKHLPQIEDVIQADVLFMTIDPTNYKEAYLDILSLITKRDRLGKATIILSSFAIDQITYTDYSKMFNKFLNVTGLSKTKAVERHEFFVVGG